MLRFFIFLCIAITVSSCASPRQKVSLTAYRVGKVIIHTNGQPHGEHVKRLLQQKIEHLTHGVANRLPPNAPTRDLRVSITGVKFVQPNGIVVPGRSAIRIQYAFDPAAPGTRYIIVGDVVDPPLEYAFNPGLFFSFEPTFDRLTERVSRELVGRLYFYSNIKSKN